MKSWLRSLGNTGIEVSALGLGCAKLGRNQDHKYPNAFELPDDKAALALLHTAGEHGINLLDTAAAYGTSESRLGNLLRGQRERWVLCSKAGEHWTPGRSTFDFSAAAIRSSLNSSLRHLRTSYLDILLLHSNGHDIDILERRETLDCLRQLKAAGKVRAIGFSAKTAAGARLAAQELDVVMLEPAATAAVTDCYAQGCGVLIKKPLASGAAITADARSMALRQCLHASDSGAVVFGTINPQHLIDNVAVARRLLDQV